MRNRAGVVVWVALAIGAAAVHAGSAETAAEPASPEARAVASRLAIERVQFEDRDWPESNSAPRPAFEEVVSAERIAAGWQDTRARRALLEERFGIAITGEALQIELNRMAAQTRDPRRLARLFAALDDDPERAALYLAQPALVERLLRQAHASDPAIRAAARAAIDPAWRSARDLATLRALARDEDRKTWARRDSATPPVEGVTALDAEAFEALRAELRALLRVERLAAGQVSDLIEDRQGLRRIAIESAENDRLEAIVRFWPLESVDAWVARNTAATGAAAEIDAADPTPPAGGYTLPAVDLETAPGTTGVAAGIRAGSCTDDTWRSSLQQEPLPRSDHTAVWTGTEMIVYGGRFLSSTRYDDGARYDPATDTWTPISIVGAPGERDGHTTVWTGTEMLVYGGYPDGAQGGRYDPATDTWSPMSDAGAPGDKQYHVAVWTGDEMLVWGGDEFNGGGRYDPDTDTWSSMSSSGAPDEYLYSTAVWTGTEMIVFGGGESPYDGVGNDGGRYNPATDTWQDYGSTPMPETARHVAVWTGTEMIVYGGLGLVFDPKFGEEVEGPVLEGARYNPTTNSWVGFNSFFGKVAAQAVWDGNDMLIYGGDAEYSDFGAYRISPSSQGMLAFSPLQMLVSDATAVWTGNEMIVWGGFETFGIVPQTSEGIRYFPTTDSWLPTYRSGAASMRIEHTAVWTGAEMIVWSGRSNFGIADVGVRYDPALDLWSPVSDTGAPGARTRHRATWTGSEMVVFGGYDGSYLGDGGRYDPATDTWATLPTTGAPSIRAQQVQLWTGDRLLIWGGFAGGTDVRNDGALYDPVGDSWTATSLVGAPPGRSLIPGVWTGTQLFVYGGFDGLSGTQTDGALYDPATGVWAPISTVGAPPATRNWAGAWTGERVLVWGGSANQDPGIGGLYDPATDSWTPTSTVDAPPGRPDAAEFAAWTGDELLIWGGRPQSSGNRVDTGARYDATADSWTAMSTPGAPRARNDHTGVWTGTEYLIFGGIGDSGFSDYLPGGGAYCAASGSCTALDWYRDADGDGIGDAGDVVSECTAPAGYVGAAGDCDDGNGTVNGTPGETATLLLTHDAGAGSTDLTWGLPAMPGGDAGALAYDVLASLDATDFGAATATCAATGVTSTSTADGVDPAPGQVVFFLVRATNACPAGAGTIGFASDGGERSGRACP